MSKDRQVFEQEWHPYQCRCKSCHHVRLMEQKVLDEFDEEMNHLEDEFQRTKVFTSTCQRYIETEWPGEEVDDPKNRLAGSPGRQAPDQNCNPNPHWSEWDAQQVPDRMGSLRQQCLNLNEVNVDTSVSYDGFNGIGSEHHTVLQNNDYENLDQNNSDCISRCDSFPNHRRRGNYDEGRGGGRQDFGDVNAAVYTEGRKKVKRSLTLRIKSSIKKRYHVVPSRHTVE